MTRAISFVCFASVLFLAACAAPKRPTTIDMDLLDAKFREPLNQAKDKVSEILKKEELLLEDVLRLSDLLNPTLKSHRKDVDLAGLEAWDAAIFPNPEFRFQVEDFPTSEGRSLGNAERTISVAQSIPVEGRLGAASSVAEKERQVAALRYLLKRRAFLTDVKRAFLDVLAARENVQLTRMTRDLAKEFHDLAEERFKAQAIPEMEVLKAAVNLAKVQTDLTMAEKDMAISIKALHVLMGDVDYPVERFKGSLFVKFETPGLETLKGQILAGHPELELARKEKELAESALSLSHAEKIPDVTLDFGYGWTPDDRILEFGISVPLQIFNRSQAKSTASTIRVRQAELNIDAVKNAVTLSLIESYRNFSSSQERVTTYRETILPKAQKALDQTNEGYKAGKFSYLDVLDSQQTLAEARIAYVSALWDLNRLAAELEKVTGTRLTGIR